MSGLRFCHLTTFYPPYNFGGDGMGIQRLCRGLARRGHQVTVVHDADAYNALHEGPEPGPAQEPEGLEVIPLKSGVGTLSPLLTQQLGRPVFNAGRIRKILAEGRFDVINYHNVSLVGGPGLWALGDAIKLYMAHEHWLVCPSHVLWRHNRELCTGRQCLRCVVSYRRPPQLWRTTKGLQKRQHHVDTFIAMSRFSREKHREFGFEPPMEVLPYFLGDPAPGEGPAARADGDSPHARPYFLFVGRLEKIKGLQDVIPLFATYAEADLVIAGDGEYAAELRALAGTNERVHFLGRVAPEELARHYTHSIALIVPSICFETFGIILIEAFRAGTPVIARRLGPFPEIVETAQAGELFSSPAEILAAMKRLQSDPELRRRYVENGWRAFVEHWSESAVLPRYLDLVRRAAERRGRLKVLEALTSPASRSSTESP
jgi:glycosyltransferase involved in cell wall biosynthesis